jgi:hypothetical protein
MHLLHKLTTYSLAVSRPWRVIMGPTEYCITILLRKPSQNLPHVSLLEAGIPDCRLPWVFSKRKLFLMDIENGVKDDSSDHMTPAFPCIFLVQVLWSCHHYLHIWTLLSVIRGLAIAALPWLLDFLCSRRTVFVETGSSRWIFSSAVLSPALQ